MARFISPHTSGSSFMACCPDGPEGENLMNWATPEFEEIQLCCEINSYTSAWLQSAEQMSFGSASGNARRDFTGSLALNGIVGS
jgi:coenzyme PQQ precursor peptide PqqA